MSVRDEGEEYQYQLSLTREEFPDFRVEWKKDSTLMHVIDFLLRVITLNRMKTYMTSFITTVGTTVYVPAEWGKYAGYTQAGIIRHERVHMRQRRAMGTLIFSLVYLFVPVPAVFAIGRRTLEMEAYHETLVALAEYYGANAIKTQSLRDRMIQHFTGPEYFWMWPFRSRIERWYDGVVAGIETEVLERNGAT